MQRIQNLAFRISLPRGIEPRGESLRHRFARYAFQLELLAHLLLESGVGTEDDLVAADHVGRLELGVGEGLGIVALAL